MAGMSYNNDIQMIQIIPQIYITRVTRKLRQKIDTSRLISRHLSRIHVDTLLKYWFQIQDIVCTSKSL